MLLSLIMRRLVARSKISAMKYLLNCQKAGHGAEDIPALKVWKAQSPRVIFSTISTLMPSTIDSIASRKPNACLYPMLQAEQAEQ